MRNRCNERLGEKKSLSRDRQKEGKEEKKNKG